jgi:hypothetical protein
MGDWKLNKEFALADDSDGDVLWIVPERKEK